MAGNRRRSGKPTQAQARYERRRRLLTDRLARATSGAERMAAAYDYARLVLAARAVNDPHAADALAADLTHTIIAAAEAADSCRR